MPTLVPFTLPRPFNTADVTVHVRTASDSAPVSSDVVTRVGTKFFRGPEYPGEAGLTNSIFRSLVDRVVHPVLEYSTGKVENMDAVAHLVIALKVRTAADTISTVTDAAVRVGVPFRRTGGDSAPATDDGTRQAGIFFRSASDNISGTFGDAATRNGTRFFRTAADTDANGVTDVATRFAARSRTASETLTLSDLVTRIGTWARAPGDNISGLSDAAVQVLTSKIGRPISTIAGTGWTPAPLWDQVNEAVADDLDAARSPNNSSNPGEFLLSETPTPLAGSASVVRYRVHKVGAGTADFLAELVQGTTVIASWTHTNVSRTYTTFQQQLTTGEKAAITNRTDLRVRITPTVVG